MLVFFSFSLLCLKGLFFVFPLLVFFFFWRYFLGYIVEEGASAIDLIDVVIVDSKVGEKDLILLP